MKKYFIILMIVIALGLVIIADLDQHYELPGYIVEVDGDLVTVETLFGELFDFYGEGFRTGERVVLQMKNRHTDSILDDEVIGVRYK